MLTWSAELSQLKDMKYLSTNMYTMSSYFSLEKIMRIKRKLEYMKYNLENLKLIIPKYRKVSPISLALGCWKERICVVTASRFSLLIHKCICILHFYKSVCKFEINIVYFRECRYEMVFHGTWCQTTAYCSKFLPSFLIETFSTCYKFVASSVMK